MSRVIIFTTLRKSITHIVACLAQHKEVKAKCVALLLRC